MTSSTSQTFSFVAKGLYRSIQQRKFHRSIVRWSKVDKHQHEPCIFSGIQPTGIPHIGNYFGAIRPWVDSQNIRGNVILSIVDLHSITIPQDPKLLRSNILDMVASLLACGIDPDKTILFQQSSVSQHAELAWILGCITNMTRLQHLPQWKAKSELVKEVPLGLFTYPVLQSSDILLYRATHVPVGEDQDKHIELTRHLAKAFNRKYANLFPLPRAVFGELKRIKSLRQVGNKMSKSDADARSRIELTDNPDLIREKLKKAVTDMNPVVTYDPESRPGVSNLIDIHCGFSGKEAEVVCAEASHLDTLQYKMRVADTVVSHLEPIRQEIIRIRDDPVYIEHILAQGQEKAQAIASNTYQEVRKALGFV